MKAQHDIYFEAVRTRDRRFDGKFFVGVKTTGIYCRPICPAKPKRQNVEFFKNALAAEKAGYRACLRCRPESAPGSPAWYGTSTTVDKGLRLITRNRLASMDENEFSSLLGVSARHLRRLFEQEIGKSPKQIHDLYRLDFARKLIVETSMPMTEVALSSGFSSLRRFNDAMKKRFHRSPREMRSKRASNSDKNIVSLSLSYRPPLDWAHLLDYFRSHQMSGIDHVNGNKFQRVFRAGNSVGCFEISPGASDSEMILRVSVPDPRMLFWVVQNVRQMFDLDSDPLIIGNAFADTKILGPLYVKRPGLRLTKAWDPFESAVHTILGQLVSIEQASRMIGQLISSEGEKRTHPWTGEPVYLFPSPEKLAQSSLLGVGTTSMRKATIKELARRVWKKELSLDASADADELKKNLLSIKGIGPWSAEYISLRALGDTDAFPGTDLILKRFLDQNPKFSLDAVKPWRGYAAIHLWKEFAEPLSKKKGKSA